jgi:hypothetical protein
VAEHLSGADFDGDHVVVIPNNRGDIKRKHPLDGLKGFDPRSEYGPYDGLKTIDGGVYNAATKKVDYGKDANGNPRRPKTSNKQNEMGKVTNLIADMTIKGANNDELARAVRHSMVVIDSEKHNLDYKASEKANGILDLKRKYQGVNEKGQLKGASTLITRATSRQDVPKRKARLSGEGGPIDPATGRKMYTLTGETDKQGNIKKFRSKKLAETEDAFTLVSEHGGYTIERVYAEHSNKLKALANEARKEMLKTEPLKRSPSAAKVYEKEVKSLTSQLNEALKNAPLERQAQVVAGHIVAQTRRANPDMEKSELRKLKGRALDEARLRTGAGKTRIAITDREWEAIQAGAISKETLKNILNNTDVDKLKERATPRDKPVMTKTATTRAKNMLASGFTLEEVSDALGIAPSTLQSGLKEGG